MLDALTANDYDADGFRTCSVTGLDVHRSAEDMVKLYGLTAVVALVGGVGILPFSPLAIGAAVVLLVASTLGGFELASFGTTAELVGAGAVFGADLLVDSATEIALMFGVPDTVIGLTLEDWIETHLFAVWPIIAACLMGFIGIAWATSIFLKVETGLLVSIPNWLLRRRMKKAWE